MKTVCWVIFLCFLFSCTESSKTEKPVSTDDKQQEVMYHVVQRSFYDSNGDLNGDLNGIREKLDYLQELGVTSILMLPLYESVYYHNYFASDFKKIDPKFGTTEDYINLVKEIHRRGMKIYMDMETQYVTEDHPWYKDSYGNPASPFSDYITYDDSAQKKPSTIVYDLEGLKGFDGTYRRITTVNMNSEKVKQYNYQLFSYWMDPNEDGDYSDGVDGFRLDHMMDDLDHKGRWKNLFQNFWVPLIEKLKTKNPNIIIMAEQADWGSFGLDYFSKAHVDRVFAFRIAFEIRNFNKNKLALMADSIFSLTPPNKDQIVFIENHDMPRFASIVKDNPGKLRVGAALNLLLGGVPSIYYGQEIGMKGAGGWNKYGMTDANEIPEREAFEWYKSDSGKGMAFWYRNSGPWWDSTNVIPDDGISVEEQINDTASLLNFYKKMIHLRKTHTQLFDGKYQTIPNNSDSVFSFLRVKENKAALVVVSFSSSDESVAMDMEHFIPQEKIIQLSGNNTIKINHNTYTSNLAPYAINVYELTKTP